MSYRTGLIAAQWLCGILNAHGFVKAIAAGEWFFAVFAGIIVLVVASWKIPPKAE